MSNIFCLWSGGLDSTYMVNKFLEEGHTVVTGHVYLENNIHSMLREADAREPMAKYFQKKFPDTFVNMGKLYSIDAMIHNDTIPLKQAFLWMMSYLTLPNYSYRKIDKFALGYVMNDDALSYLDELRNIFKTLNDFAESEIELIFPIIKCHKMVMYNELPDILRNNITWCDKNEEILDPCGSCVSCKRMDNAGIIFPFKEKVSIPEQLTLELKIKYDEIKTYECCTN